MFRSPWNPLVAEDVAQLNAGIAAVRRVGALLSVKPQDPHITDILPCTLMSPDSVARFFPAKPDIFDVVVFDEASQIRVADAIGAMGRAKSVVVVGDSKQMPPTSFAEANATVDDDEDYNPDVVVDEESILTECVQALVPQQWLSWHYRSQDEALIAFSNIHYYRGQLASFPAPHAGDSGHGISLVRVDGHFERSGKGKTLRTNRVEADRIVDDIRRRFDASPDTAPSLGVITFNAQQRDLIENLLRDAGDDRLAKLVAGAFGLGRVNDDRRRAIQRLVPAEHLRKGEEFYWPVDVDPGTWRLVRQPEPGATRPLDEVSLTELGNAMFIVVEQTGGIARDELKRDALAIFGGRRVTQAIGARLDDALDRAVDRGLLRLSPAGLVVAP